MMRKTFEMYLEEIIQSKLWPALLDIVEDMPDVDEETILKLVEKSAKEFFEISREIGTINAILQAEEE